MRHPTVLPAPVLARVACAFALLGGALSCDGAPDTEPASTGATPSATAASGGSLGAGKNEASAQLAYQTALQLLLKSQPEAARDELRRAVQLDPRMGEGFFELGKLLVHLSSQSIGSQARDLDILGEGLTHLEKATELEPNNDHYHYWLGRAHFIAYDKDAAIVSLRRAVEINPKHALAWKKLGLVMKDAGNMAEAQAYFLKAIEHDPEEAGSYFQLGQVLETLSELEKAREAYEKSIELDPTAPEVFGRLTQVCAMLGDAAGEERARVGMEGWKVYDQKLQKRRRAVNLNPSDAAALLRLGEMYFQVGNWEEALEWFLKSIFVDPSDALAHLYCGIARRHLRDYANALNHLKEAEFLAPEYLDPKLEFLRVYSDSGDEASFEALLAQVEVEAAEDGASLHALAEVARDVGQEEDAKRLFQKAAALGVTQSPEAASPPDEEE